VDSSLRRIKRALVALLGITVFGTVGYLALGFGFLDDVLGRARGGRREREAGSGQQQRPPHRRTR
jgi:hypothetical protein